MAWGLSDEVHRKLLHFMVLFFGLTEVLDVCQKLKFTFWNF